jgi:hypothetical protein
VPTITSEVGESQSEERALEVCDGLFVCWVLEDV